MAILTVRVDKAFTKSTIALASRGKGIVWYGIRPPHMMEERWMAWRSRSKSERV
jgi:hypothetical protein